MHGRRRRHRQCPARRLQRRHAPAEGQRRAARRGWRDAVPDSGQCPIPARTARDALCRERGQRGDHRARYARRPCAVRVRADAGRRSRDCPRD